MKAPILDINNKNEFEILFKGNYKTLCNTALKIVNDKTIAEDIVQEVFIRIWENRLRYNIETNQYFYLNRAVINSCYNFLKKKKNISLSQLSTDEIQNIGFYSNMEDKLDFKKLSNLIDKSINNLPPKCKTIFILSRFENLKYKEIAEILDISIKTVENQMGIAIGKLHNELKLPIKKHFPELLFTILIICFYLLNHKI